MITEDLIKRINELAARKKTVGLSEKELAEQKKLYKIYLSSVRKQVITQLDEAGIRPEGHAHHCCDDNCSHNHHHHHGPNCNHDRHK